MKYFTTLKNFMVYSVLLSCIVNGGENNKSLVLNILQRMIQSCCLPAAI